MKEACEIYPEKWYAKVPPPLTLAPASVVCEMPNQHEVEQYLGNYEHPLFGRVSIAYWENRLKWTFGIYGRGALCHVQQSPTEPDSFRMRWDENTIFGAYNAELETYEHYNLINFKRKSNGQVEKLEFVMIEPMTKPEFNKIS